MKESFRQSMAWLHTWAGLLVGWVLYFVFLTGTLGYAAVEIDQWMRPERPAISSPLPSSHLVRLAEQRLRSQAAGASFWQIMLTGQRGGGDFSVGWIARGPNGQSQFTRETLDRRSGEPSQADGRATAGGLLLYRMHYVLHYMPKDWGIFIVGVCSMFMFVAILTGIVAHKKIFADFFTLRFGKGQRSWLDSHNLLSVTALPFHVMITWSGLVFWLFFYMPIAAETLYPRGAGQDRLRAEAYGVSLPEVGASNAPAPLVPIGPLLSSVEAEWGARPISYINIENPGRENARITFYELERGIARNWQVMHFDGATGTRLPSHAPKGAGLFVTVLLGLHDGQFAGPILRGLYLLAGFAGTAMIATGLILWSVKRKAKLAREVPAGLGIALVDALNLGTIIGLPIGIAAYFWANRLLPLDMANRAEWEVHSLFMVWGATFICAAWCRGVKAWRAFCWIAAGAYAALPMVNAATTQRHLGVTLASGDWLFAGFDLSALLAGACFAAMAWLLGMRGKMNPHAKRKARSS